MKKILFLIGILFCIYSCRITKIIPIEGNDYLLRTYNLPDSLSYQVVEIINPIIYNMLDDVLELSKTCLFTKDEQPCRFTFRSYSLNDTTTFFCSAEQYDHLFYWGTYYDSLFSKDKYCFIYKDIWFTGNVFPNDSDNDHFSDYFKLTNQEKKINIFFPNQEVFYWQDLFLSYFGDKAVVHYDFYSNDITYIEREPCANIDKLYYTVKKKENLNEIAKKYHTTEEHLQRLNPQIPLDGNLPVGKRIRVQ